VVGGIAAVMGTLLGFLFAPGGGRSAHGEKTKLALGIQRKNTHDTDLKSSWERKTSLDRRTIKCVSGGKRWDTVVQRGPGF